MQRVAGTLFVVMRRGDGVGGGGSFKMNLMIDLYDKNPVSKV
jgi:hypothetical protein